MADDNDNPQHTPASDDPITDAQRVYLDTLANQVGDPSSNDDLTKAEASERIEALRKRTGLNTEEE